MHREIKTYTCNDCQTQYGTKKQLDSHKRKDYYLPKLHLIVITVTNHSHISATYDSITKFVRVTRENQKKTVQVHQIQKDIHVRQVSAGTC